MLYVLLFPVILSGMTKFLYSTLLAGGYGNLFAMSEVFVYVCSFGQRFVTMMKEGKSNRWKPFLNFAYRLTRITASQCVASK